MNMNQIICDKFGKDCGNIISNYKKDLDNYNECSDTYDKMFSMLFAQTYLSNSNQYNHKNEKVLRIYNKLKLSDFLYFIKYYKGKDEKKILSYYKFRTTIRDDYGNYNKDYFLTNKKFKLKRFLEFDYYSCLEIKSIRKVHNNELKFHLHDNYIKKQKSYHKIYKKIKEKLISWYN